MKVCTGPLYYKVSLFFFFFLDLNVSDEHYAYPLIVGSSGSIFGHHVRRNIVVGFDCS